MTPALLLLFALPAALPVALPAAPQGPAPGEVGKFRWPPQSASKLRYKVSFVKERKLPKDVAKAEQAARKAAGKYIDRKASKQKIAIDMTVALDVTDKEVKGTFTTTLGKHSLRLAVPKPQKKKRGNKGKATDASTTKSGAAPILGNGQAGWVWGHPSSKDDEPMTAERGAIERTFEHTWQRNAGKGSKSEDLRRKFGDHLLPLYWTYPMPCWIGTFVDTMDLGGEAVIGGKQLMQDATTTHALGYRQTSVTGEWTKASASAFTMKYKMKVEQFVSNVRATRPMPGGSMTWVIEVDGLATYSFRDQAWDTITEKVTARPKKLKDGHLQALSDEVYAGTIKVQRVRETKGRRRRRR